MRRKALFLGKTPNKNSHCLRDTFRVKTQKKKWIIWKRTQKAEQVTIHHLYNLKPCYITQFKGKKTKNLIMMLWKCHKGILKSQILERNQELKIEIFSVLACSRRSLLKTRENTRPSPSNNKVFQNQLQIYIQRIIQRSTTKNP